MSRRGKARNIAATVHKFVNNKRDENGRSKLRGNTDLAAIAESYAKEMAGRGQIGHHVDGSNPQARAPRFRGVSENCSKVVDASRSVESIAGEATTRWLHSDGHRQNILRPKSAHSGVGVWIKRGDVYIVHMFACKRGLMQTAVEVSRSIA